eukprot:622525-Prorocentrum_lima.AAC.1
MNENPCCEKNGYEEKLLKFKIASINAGTLRDPEGGKSSGLGSDVGALHFLAKRMEIEGLDC